MIITVKARYTWIPPLKKGSYDQSQKACLSVLHSERHTFSMTTLLEHNVAQWTEYKLICVGQIVFWLNLSLVKYESTKIWSYQKDTSWSPNLIL